MLDICAYLDAHGIPCERFDHPAVFTCEQSKEIAPPMPGSSTKNLFLRDRKGARHFLVVVEHEKKVDLKALADMIGTQKLSFGSAERLERHLGVAPGSVTVLGLAHDLDHAVEVFFDAPIWKADRIQCHPLVNTASLIIPHDGLERFLHATGHTPHIIDVPGKG